MDPQDPTTPAVPDRPMTRRELRERERAQQEAAQRMLAPQRRAYPAPGSAFPRPTSAPQAAPARPAAPPAAAPSAGADSADVSAGAASAGATTERPAPSAQRSDGHSPQTHGRRRARAAEPLQPASFSAGSVPPTSAAMGWGSYPPSSGSGARAFAPASAPAYAPPSPITVPDAGAPSILPSPVPAARSSLLDVPTFAAPIPEGPAFDEASLEMPARDVPAPAPEAEPHTPLAPSSAAGEAMLAEEAMAPATAYLPAVSPDEPIRRNVFPAAAHAFARGATMAPEQPASDHQPLHHAGIEPVPADHYDGDYYGVLGHHLDAHDHLDAPADDVFAHPADHAHEFDHGLQLHPLDDARGVFGEPVAAKPRKSRRVRVVVGLALALALFVGAALIGVEFLKPILGIDKVTDFPGPGTGTVTVTVQPGSGAAAVASTLQQKDVIADAGTFLKAFAAAGGNLHPGDYTFKKEMKSSDAAQILVGTSNDKVIYFALNAGMRAGESLDAIAKAASVDRKDLDALNAKPTDFGLPAKAKSLEGYLAPGEYRFPVGTSAKDILTKLVTTTLDKLKADGITDPAKQYDVLTVASIVQAEGGRADYGNVAGAIYNRLKPNTETNGYIQSDATVTYGLGKKSYHITEDEKADKSNPYNTYANPGLPAGPIGSPGASAIDAAAKPTPNDYLYWVTVNLDTGETKFSKTYAEHQIYAQQYAQWCQANAGKCQ